MLVHPTLSNPSSSVSTCGKSCGAIETDRPLPSSLPHAGVPRALIALGGPIRSMMLAVATLLAVCLPTEKASAYSWMLRHHYEGCGTCHADPSGGETLTEYGRMQGELLLRTQYGKPSVKEASSSKSNADFDSFDSFDSSSGLDDSSPATTANNETATTSTATDEAPPEHIQEFLWGLVHTPPELMLGGSVRVATLTRPLADTVTPKIFPMQADLYGVGRLSSFELGGSLGVARVPMGSEHARRAQVTTAQGESFNLLSRTHWIGWTPATGWLVRAGRLNLPFGIRIPEHVFLVRSQTQTDRESDQQHGLAVAYSGSGVRAEVMGIAGNFQVNPDRYRERGYAGFVELMISEGLGAGLSSLVTVAEADVVLVENLPTDRQAHGIFARYVPWPSLVCLLEADLLWRSRRDVGYVGMLQTDVELTRGLHWLTTGEVLDAGYRPDPTWAGGRTLPGNGQPRFAGWLGLDWFFWSHMDVRAEVRYLQPVLSSAKQNSLEILTQFHAYL